MPSDIYQREYSGILRLLPTIAPVSASHLLSFRDLIDPLRQARRLRLPFNDRWSRETVHSGFLRSMLSQCYRTVLQVLAVPLRLLKDYPRIHRQSIRFLALRAFGATARSARPVDLFHRVHLAIECISA